MSQKSQYTSFWVQLLSVENLMKTHRKLIYDGISVSKPLQTQQMLLVKTGECCSKGGNSLVNHSALSLCVPGLM